MHAYETLMISYRRFFIITSQFTKEKSFCEYKFELFICPLLLININWSVLQLEITMLKNIFHRKRCPHIIF